MGEIAGKITVESLVVHPVRYAMATSDGKAVAHVEGPFIEKPVITTGAGDHFNAGFCLGQLMGLDHAGSLICGVGTSGYYVRNGVGPDPVQLASLLRDWPEQDR
jgi:sugar/nucleoside kinase (ribokinase family)